MVGERERERGTKQGKKTNTYLCDFSLTLEGLKDKESSVKNVWWVLS